MRTDSTNVAELAQDEARAFIRDATARNSCPISRQNTRQGCRRTGSTRSHPADLRAAASRICSKNPFNRDQFRLYQLIWQRFVASQMSAAIYDTLSIDVLGTKDAHSYMFRASGSTVVFQSFLIVYEEARDEDQKPDEEKIHASHPVWSKTRPSGWFGLSLSSTSPNPPLDIRRQPLVRALEENGIGRPSTYAPILATIPARGYVIREGRKLTPPKPASWSMTC